MGRSRPITKEEEEASIAGALGARRNVGGGEAVGGGTHQSGKGYTQDLGHMPRAVGS